MRILHEIFHRSGGNSPPRRLPCRRCIFNPILQGEKFDPTGQYIRRWCPELSELPKKWIHHPWTAPADVLSTAGITLGDNYPLPIIDHAAARRIALESFAQISRSRGKR